MNSIFKKQIFTILIVCFFFSLSGFANVKPNSLFSNNMVLQQGVNVPVWGQANENETITVELCGQKISTIAKDGKWFIQFSPLKAGGPFEMLIKGQNTITITNVMIGEVWVCGGQSNMARRLGYTQSQKPIVNWQQEVKDAANYSNIRQYAVQTKASAIKLQNINSSWVVCDTTNVKNFTAVGYFFARDLAKTLKVPVGIIYSNVGGSSAEKWTSRAALENNPELRDIVNKYDKSVLDFPAVLAKYKQSEDSLLMVWRADSTKAANLKKNIARKPRAPLEPSQTGECGGFFNGMIAPLIPFAIKGVIWYQGEANNTNPKLYQTLLPALIADWRKAWNQGDFPFLFVQIAPYYQTKPELREAQLLTWKKTPNTAMAVTVDCGDSTDIHPANKLPVGERLALAARAIAYNQKITYSGPVYTSMEVKDNTIVLTFDFVGKGLIAKDGELKGFVIAGEDKKFIPAKAIIKDNKVIVSSDKIKNPTAVRMGWLSIPHVNLYNQEGLPASPFRTDIQ